MRHNDLLDITAGLLSRVCSDVATEPPLQPLSGEVITPKSANQQDDAWVDIHARGFWGWRQSAFLYLCTQKFKCTKVLHTQRFK